MKRFLLSLAAVMLFAVAPASAIVVMSPMETLMVMTGTGEKSDYQKLMSAFDSREWSTVHSLLGTISMNDLNGQQQAYVELVQGKYFLSQKNHKVALVHFVAYTEYDGKPAHSDSQKSWGYRGRAECHLAMGNLSLALSDIDKSLEFENGSRPRFIKARILFNKGAFSSVVKILDPENTPKKATYWNLKGLAQIELGLYQDAILTLKSATGFGNAPGYVWNNLATALLRQDAVDYSVDGMGATTALLKEAIDALDKAIEKGSTKAKGSKANAEEALTKRSL